MILYVVNTANEFAQLLGAGFFAAVGNSLVILSLLLLITLAYIAWRQQLTMEETYFVAFIIFGFLRIFANDSQFNDVGTFGLLHNLLMIGSAIVWAIILATRNR